MKYLIYILIALILSLLSCNSNNVEEINDNKVTIDDENTSNSSIEYSDTDFDAEEVARICDDTMRYDKFDNINSISYSGDFAQSGNVATFIINITRPNKYKFEAIYDSKVRVIRIFDGKKGWLINSLEKESGPQEITGDDLLILKKGARLEDPLHNWKTKGYSLESKGLDLVEGRPVYKISLLNNEEPPTYYYIDTINYTILKQSMYFMYKGEKHESESIMNDYRLINGLMIPFEISEFIDNKLSNQLRIKKIKFNKKT